MKKVVFAAALASISSMAAHAQDSGNGVTLYGLINASLSYESAKTENGGASWKQPGCTVSCNRWGLRGTENLGGGTRAIFTLESGFGANQGALAQGGRMFGRQAFAGLSNDNLGTLTLGRQYDSVVTNLSPLSLTGMHYGGGMTHHPDDNDNLGHSIRINNSIKYQSPDYNGFKFSGLYGFSNKAGDFTNNRAYSFGTSYANGPLELAAGFLQVHGAKNAGEFNANGTVDNLANFENRPFSSQVFDFNATGNTEQKRIFGLGAAYAFGPAKVGLLWTQSREVIYASFTNVANPAAVGLFNTTTLLNNIELNGRYMITPAISLSGGYTYTFGSTSSAETEFEDKMKAKLKFHTFAAQATYAFSKRTDVYLAGTYRLNTRSGDVEVEQVRQYLITGNADAPKRSQTIIATGLRHRF